MSLREDLKKIKCGRKELKDFGIAGCIFFLIVTGLVWLVRREIRPVPAGLACFFGILGLAAPMLLGPVYKIAMPVALSIGWVMTRVILFAGYYLILTPVAVIARLSGADFLKLKKGGGADSYWIPRQPETRGRERYEKQF